ncbi:MAG TPA: D-aminoacylase [Thermodesulfobacteriota bacterium]|nr:D-aminoacylase [Thermodesulfobacteriota bacterium]
MSSFFIRGAQVIDGSNREPFRGDIAVDNGIITEVSSSIRGGGKTVIEADGLVAAPGFIDIHSHTDLSIFKHPLAQSKALQGVTTEVVGNCGIGAFPVDDERKSVLIDYLKMHDFYFPSDGLSWNRFTQYADYLDRIGLGLNLAPLVAHGALRIAILGAEDRVPNDKELERMKTLLSDSLEQGAWGLSTGLIYPPGSFAKTEELVDLVKILAHHGALYASHIRGEGATLMEALEEAIAIGKKGGARVEVSHLKAMGKGNWGRGKKALLKLEKARQSGVDIGADQYPYEATSTSLTALVPSWAHAGGVSELLKRLGSPETTERLQSEILREMTQRGGPSRIVISEIGSVRNVGLSGKNVSQIADLWQCPPERVVMRLLLEEKAAVGAVYFSLSDEDVTAILSSDQVSVGSDGTGMNAKEDLGTSTHPRSYGTFARILGFYAGEKKTLSLAKAIHKMTGLPAARLRLKNRGLIKPGFIADLVLFDPLTIQDRSTFDHPHQYATGVVYTWVNGCAIVREGIITGNTPGRVLRKRE